MFEEITAKAFLRQIFPYSTIKHTNEEGKGFVLIKVSDNDGKTFKCRNIILNNNTELTFSADKSYWSDFRTYTTQKRDLEQVVDYRALVIKINEDKNSTLKTIKSVNAPLPTFVIEHDNIAFLVFQFPIRVSKYDDFDIFLYNLYLGLCKKFSVSSNGFNAIYPIFSSTVKYYKVGNTVPIEELSEFAEIPIEKIKYRADTTKPHKLFEPVYKGWLKAMSDEYYHFTTTSAEALFEIGYRANITEEHIKNDIKCIILEKGVSDDVLTTANRSVFRNYAYEKIQQTADIFFSKTIHKPRKDNTEEVKQWYTTHPTGTVRQCEQDTGIPKSTVCRILKKLKS